MKLNILLKSVSLISLSLIAVGCAQDTTKSSTPNHSKEADHAKHMSGDKIEETSSSVILPTFLKTQPEDVRNVYQAVAKNRKLLEKMPCYCGCGETVNHKNNYDCFIEENTTGGSVKWTSHGTTCSTCLEIAVKSILKQRDGESIKDIRSEIDSSYKDGYSKPTPTPL